MNYFLLHHFYLLLLKNPYKLHQSISTKMNINTTLVIFAALAALGLMTALMVVEPNVANARNQQSLLKKQNACVLGPGQAHFCS
jgi:hypothetical protein